MLFNFWGIAAVDTTPAGLEFVSEESRVMLTEGNSTPLLKPPVDEYLKFSIGGNRVVGNFRKEGDHNRINHAQGEWLSPHSFLGGQPSYAFFNEEQDNGQDLYVARRWDGELIFQMPYYYAERYLAPTAIALGNQQQWAVYDLAGTKLEEITGVDRSERRWRPRFTDDLFFFRTTEESIYQVYDVAQRAFAGSISVVDGLVGVLALPSGGTLLVDAEGVKLLGASAGSALRTVHRFDQPLDADGNDFLGWHDGTRACMAFTGWLQPQVLLAIPLSGVGHAGPVPVQAEELRWDTPWEITNQCGLVDGLNYLTLRRKDLLAESALLMWRPDEPLTHALLEPHLSPVVRVTQPPSPKKGKHCYRIEIEDASSTNRAVRSAAFELGRLLSESCSGPYNNAQVIPDRQFDGQFYIDITCAAEPDALERGYLADYIQYFRHWGGLSPAGSRAALKDPVITWNIGVP